MKEENDSNWFRKWEEELPSAEDLMPLTQSLITPDLAQAFNIQNEMEMEMEMEEPARTLKRPRLVWTPQLHKRFVDAVAHLGIKNAVPKTIMQLMSVEGLTRENVASHLQKYRLYLKRMQTTSISNHTPDHFMPFLHFTHFSTPPIRQPQPSNDDGTKILTLFPTADH